MDITVRRLGAGDEPVLRLLALEDGDFDVTGRGEALEPLAADAAQHFLANPAVLFWAAQAENEVIGFLYCLQVPMRTGPCDELLLYEIGVRSSWRRQGVGQRLIATMDAWMNQHAIDVVWVGADNPGAEAFYAACDFEPDEPRPVVMSRTFL